MISRRLLRVKILQVLYANHNKEGQTISQAEKELFFSINKSYDLFHLFLLLPVELAKIDEQRIDIVKQRRIQTIDELEVSTHFADNKMVAQIKKNWQLSRYVSDNKINWSQSPEIIKSLYQQIKERDYFKHYLTKETPTYEDDKKLILKILEEEIATYEPLGNTLEDLSIFWNDDMDFVLNMVIKTIKGFKETDGQQKTLMPLFKNEEDHDFVKALFRKVSVNGKEYDSLIKKHSQNWEFERIALMDILIMQMAIAEIVEFPSIPIKVSLNEYIDIAKDYSTANSNTFINGILDNIVKEYKAENKIIKTGRGLMDK
jgi:transcription antitermination protein NusB